jgi:hypothetical protein
MEPDRLETVIEDDCDIVPNAGSVIAAIIHACQRGDLDFIRWLICQTDIDEQEVIEYAPEMLQAAARRGHLPLLEWLVTRYRLVEKERDERRSGIGKGRDKGSLTVGTRAILHACMGRQRGQLEVVKWLVATFEISRDEIVARRNAVFIEACLSGNVELVKWLATTFELTTREVKDGGSAALSSALIAHCTSSCSSVDLSCAQWLVDHYPYSERDVSEATLVSACRYESWEVVRWLLLTFPRLRIPERCESFVARVRRSIDEE